MGELVLPRTWGKVGAVRSRAVKLQEEDAACAIGVSRKHHVEEYDSDHLYVALSGSRAVEATSIA